MGGLDRGAYRTPRVTGRTGPTGELPQRSARAPVPSRRAPSAGPPAPAARSPGKRSGARLEARRWLALRRSGGRRRRGFCRSAGGPGRDCFQLAPCHVTGRAIGSVLRDPQRGLDERPSLRPASFGQQDRGFRAKRRLGRDQCALPGGLEERSGPPGILSMGGRAPRRAGASGRLPARAPARSRRRRPPPGPGGERS